jgi:P4 family phage/plasmid primase-like protien
MIIPYRGYVQTRDKHPCQRFAHGETLLTLEQAERYKEYAGILNGRFIVKDIDDQDEADRMYSIVQDQNLNCRVMQTTRGKHFTFALGEYALKTGARHTNPLGFTFDTRAGENSYVVLKSDGITRPILRDFDETRPLEPYPHWLCPVRGGAKFTGMTDGSGRNDALFRHIGTLVRNGYNQEEIAFILQLINDYAFGEPLIEEEFAKVSRDDSINKFIASSARFDFIGAHRPARFADVFAADKFVEEYQDKIKYTAGTGWIVWNGVKWESSELKAHDAYMEFVKRMAADAEDNVERVKNEQATRELNELIESKIAKGSDEAKDKQSDKGADKTTPKAKKKKTDDAQLEAWLSAAEAYYKFALRLCGHSNVFGVMKLVRPKVEISVNELDADPFTLNLPSGLVNLRTGEIMPHKAEHLCAKVAARDPSAKGRELWEECLRFVTIGDAEYQHYLQCLAGAIAVGRVYNENLIIAYGGGANGKSTLFNTISAVLGDYSGKIPAEALTTTNKSAKVELAEVVGKRFILAGETDEGQRLSTRMLKQMSSVDPIEAERKYRDPFVFTPTHCTVLYTNHLPRVGSTDKGTWRRLIVAPFNAEIKAIRTNYAERLLEEAGGAVMQWIIDGARMFIQNNYAMPVCSVVDKATAEYRADNDWVTAFLEENCKCENGETCMGGALYRTYREWAFAMGEYARNNADFAKALRGRGFKSQHGKGGNEWNGLSLLPERLYGKRGADFVGTDHGASETFLG